MVDGAGAKADGRRGCGSQRLQGVYNKRRSGRTCRAKAAAREKIHSSATPRCAPNFTSLSAFTYARLPRAVEQASEKPPAAMAHDESPRHEKRKRDNDDDDDESPNSNARTRMDDHDHHHPKGRGGGHRKPLQHGSRAHKKRNMGRNEHLYVAGPLADPLL